MRALVSASDQPAAIFTLYACGMTTLKSHDICVHSSEFTSNPTPEVYWLNAHCIRIEGMHIRCECNQCAFNPVLSASVKGP